MNQHTYSFPKVTPADPQELREDLRASRRQAAAASDANARVRSEAQARRTDRQN